MIGETRPSLPAQQGQAARYDYEYKRNGTRNVFLFCEPQAGWRHVAVTEQRTMQDFAYQMKWLVDERYPEAEVIRVVLDNLNTHKPASLYETLSWPASACTGASRPKPRSNGNWLQWRPHVMRRGPRLTGSLRPQTHG